MNHVSLTPTFRPVQHTVSNMAQPKPQPPIHRQGPQKQPQFGGSLLNHFDFKQLATSHINQIQVIYASCIMWRLVAANERRKASPSKSFNEIREALLRDSMGYMFWFFAVPAMQRAYLACVPKDLRTSLIQANPKTGSGIKGMLNKMNPLANWGIPSSEQVKDQMEQALLALEAQEKNMGASAYKTAKKTTEKFYSELMKHRNIATGVGLGATIALLGIGINLLNFYMTRKNVERHKAELLQHQQQHHTLPPPPRFFGPQSQSNILAGAPNPWQSFQQRQVTNHS